MDDDARQVASAINEVMRLDSADQEALLDVVLDYFCEDSMNNQHESSSDTDCSDEDDLIAESHYSKLDNPPPHQLEVNSLITH